MLREQLAAMREERAEAEKATMSLSDALTYVNTHTPLSIHPTNPPEDIRPG